MVLREVLCLPIHGTSDLGSNGHLLVCKGEHDLALVRPVRLIAVLFVADFDALGSAIVVGTVTGIAAARERGAVIHDI